MTRIYSVDNPPNGAIVDSKGRLRTKTTINSDQSDSAVDGNAFNLNSGNVILTDAVNTPIFYFKNEGEERNIIISRIFLYTSNSTGGTGPLNTNVVFNPTGGTLLTGTDLPIYNFNAGNGNQIDIISKVGVTGSTLTGGIIPIRNIYASAPVSTSITFDSIILPRGASMGFFVQPPAGNTSLIVQAGLNLFLGLTK